MDIYDGRLVGKSGNIYMEAFLQYMDVASDTEKLI